MILYKKSSDAVITTGLTVAEFKCNCSHKSCRSVMITKKLRDAYKIFREDVDTSLKINSGNRCALHNFNEGGAELSRHVSGEAIDISIVNLLEKFTVEEIRAKLKKAGFTFILFYLDKNFVHADVREI